PPAWREQLAATCVALRSDAAGESQRQGAGDRSTRAPLSLSRLRPTPHSPFPPGARPHGRSDARRTDRVVGRCSRFSRLSRLPRQIVWGGSLHDGKSTPTARSVYRVTI